MYRWANRFFLGEPTILVKHGKIIKENLFKSRLSVVELLSNLRASGYPDLSGIEDAILEPIGTLSVIPNRNLNPITPKDLGLDFEYEGLPIALVVEGRIQSRNLKLVKKDTVWLKEQLSKQGHQTLRSIMYASVRDNSAKLYVDDGSANP